MDQQPRWGPTFKEIHCEVVDVTRIKCSNVDINIVPVKRSPH